MNKKLPIPENNKKKVDYEQHFKNTYLLYQRVAEKLRQLQIKYNVKVRENDQLKQENARLKDIIKRGS